MLVLPCQTASTCGPGALGSEPVVRSRVARRAARLDDAWCEMEEPGGRFAHGFFRRTGGAGSATAPGGNRKVSGGLGPIPSQRHTAWASRHTHLRIGTCTGPCLLPHCDASRARPSSGADLRQGYSRGWDYCQEQSENITLPALLRSPLVTLCHTPTVMAGLVPAIPIWTSAAPLASGSPARGR